MKFSKLPTMVIPKEGGVTTVRVSSSKARSPSVTAMLLVASALNSRLISLTGRLRTFRSRLRWTTTSRQEKASSLEMRLSVASLASL
ncbi:hypothetical protein D3C86_1064670 [compost metagenome]